MESQRVNILQSMIAINNVGLTAPAPLQIAGTFHVHASKDCPGFSPRAPNDLSFLLQTRPVSTMRVRPITTAKLRKKPQVSRYLEGFQFVRQVLVAGFNLSHCRRLIGSKLCLKRGHTCIQRVNVGLQSLTPILQQVFQVVLEISKLRLCPLQR